MHLEGPCKPIDPGIEAAASFFNSTGRRKQKTRPLKIEISANGRGFLELAYLEVVALMWRLKYLRRTVSYAHGELQEKADEVSHPSRLMEVE